MHRIKDKDTVKMLEEVLNYSDEEKKILKENFAALLLYSSKQNIIKQISEAIKNGRTDAKLFYGKVRSPTECSVESVFVEFEEELMEG